MNLRTLIIESVLVLLLIVSNSQNTAQAQTSNQGSPMPRPQEVPAEEQKRLAARVAKEFAADMRGKFKVQGAGAYVFGGTEDFFVIERKDLGSVAYETKAYGLSNQELDQKLFSKEVLLKRADEVLRRAGYEVKDKQFANLLDEFAGAYHGMKEMPADFDPRKVSKLVARTVSFERVSEGLPVFGSELLVGINPDGKIGRFRMHWPKLSPDLFKAGRELQSAVNDKKWMVPRELQIADTEILDVSAGVGHSAFADPTFKSAAVVRVLYRRIGKGTKYPLTTTAYKFFDAAGKEVVFTSFPKMEDTPASKKEPERAQKKQ